MFTHTNRRPGLFAAWLIVTLVLSGQAQTGSNARRFFPDDPISREPETQDASKAQEWDIYLTYDLLLNLFGAPGDPRQNVRAGNVNTIDEVPDSSWFTNRIGTREVSLEEAVRGPNTMAGPAPGKWTVIAPKRSGFAPGFTVRDERGDTWFLSFDGKGQPEAASGAVAVASKLFWALGYNQVESYVARITLDRLVIGKDATIRQPSGHRRPMRMSDVERVLDRAHPSADGSYRVLAGRGLSGKVLGGFKYYGTRPDDPNDIVPHEHRRELRALKVFGAWTNLVDMKAGNTLDVVVQQDGRSVVRHYLQDVGSTFGTGAIAPREWDEGYEYLFEGDETLKRLATFGFLLPPWLTIPYERHESIGRFEGDHFDPEAWRSRVPAAAVLRARLDDTFWAALRVLAFSDELIRAIVKTGEYSNPADEKHLADVLITRRDQIGRTYLRNINPLVGFALDGNGVLSFENAAARARIAADPPEGYRAEWALFDNATGTATAFGAPTTGSAQRLEAPADLLRRAGEFVKVSISAAGGPIEPWRHPVDVYFRKKATGWELVGVERLVPPR